MGKILEALATDQLCVAPSDYKGNAGYREVRDLSCSLEKQLLEKLNEEGKKLLADYSDAQAKESRFYADHLFVKGFRLGVLMMMEVVTDSDDLIFHGDNANLRERV